jgi:hypothetical protein
MSPGCTSGLAHQRRRWREAQMLWRRLVQQELGVADHYIERYLRLLRAAIGKPSTQLC